MCYNCERYLLHLHRKMQCRSISQEHVLCKKCLDIEKEKEKVNISIFYLITN